MHWLVGLAVALSVAAPVSAGTRLEKPRHGFQVRLAAVELQPGEEAEFCEYRRLPNRKAIDVSAFETRMPPGAHHFVIWAYGGSVRDDGRFRQGPVPSVGCAGMAPDEIFPQMLIRTQPNVRVRLPPDLAIRIEPNQQVWVNPHLKNYTDTTIRSDIRLNFYRARKRHVRHYVEPLIVGNMARINVPPQGDQTLVAEWTAPVDLTLAELATHQHRLGTYASLEVVEPDGVTRTTVYENTDWQHPRSFWPEPRIRLEKGRRVRVTCRWHNSEDHPVYFGPKTTDEMCFMVGYYYRDDGDTEPVATSECVQTRRGLSCVAPALSW